MQYEGVGTELFEKGWVVSRKLVTNWIWEYRLQEAKERAYMLLNSDVYINLSEEYSRGVAYELLEFLQE